MTPRKPARWYRITRVYLRRAKRWTDWVRDPFPFLPSPNAMAVLALLFLFQALNSILLGNSPIPPSIVSTGIAGIWSMWWMFIGVMAALLSVFLQLPLRWWPLRMRVAGLWTEAVSCVPIATGAFAYSAAVNDVSPSGTYAAASSIIVGGFFVWRLVQVLLAFHKISQTAEYLRYLEAQ